MNDNAPAHTSQVVIVAATKRSFEVLPHSPYSPNLAPSDFYPFTNPKTNLRGRNFGSNKCIIGVVRKYIWGQEGF